MANDISLLRLWLQHVAGTTAWPLPVGEGRPDGSCTRRSLAFSKASKDGSGKATLVITPNSALPGVIFEIDLAEQEQLNRHEGVGSGYRREETFAIEGSTVPASSYLGTSLDHTLRPFDWYIATVIAGAEYHGLDTAHVAALRGTRFVEDTELGRRTRVEAIEAMREHGIQDYRTLLEGLG